VAGLVDHLFRREAGRITAGLVRFLGPAHLGVAEDAVQDALLQAMRLWRFRGLPDHPAAWLARVARHRALDRLRRLQVESRGRERLAAGREPPAPPPVPALAGEVSEDQLRLIFLCCHPDLPRDGRVALTLKVAAGFSARELARAFLIPEATVAQRVVRARQRIRDRGLTLEMPAGPDLAGRLEAVLEVLYLIFNEGYLSRREDTGPIRADLCRESARLAARLAAYSATARPEAHALAALLHLQLSRLPARLDGRGDLVLLDRQDRTLWDREARDRGFRHLARAAAGDRVTPWHLEAAIAAEHARAGNPGEVDWAAILGHYDHLLALSRSPVVALNRAVAVSRVHGPAAGLAALEPLSGEAALGGYALLPAVRGEMLRQTGQRQAAAAAFREALDLPLSASERKLVQRRLASCRD
jgi:RNA polymerase sigma-70 factor (ECF subfamily)